MSALGTVASGKKNDFGHQRKQSVPFAVSVITGGRRLEKDEGRERKDGRKLGRREREKRGRESPLPKIFFPVFTRSAPPFLQVPFP